MFDVFLISACMMLIFFCATGLLLEKTEATLDELEIEVSSFMINCLTLACSSIIFAWILTIILRVYEYI